MLKTDNHDDGDSSQAINDTSHNHNTVIRFVKGAVVIVEAPIRSCGPLPTLGGGGGGGERGDGGITCS